VDHQGRTNPASDLAQLVRLLVDTWNRRDALAFANLFAPHADYVTGAGERLSGREAISRLVDEAVPVVHVSRVEASVEGDPGLGSVSFSWVAAEGSGRARRGTITCACVRTAGGWLIESLRNSEAESAPESRGSRTK
jgi:hypothetical protein